jgi:hypothetical protein
LFTSKSRSVPEFERQYAQQLLLLSPSDLPSGRRVLFVCPECGDLGCGCLSAEVTRDDERVIWTNFGFENDYDLDSLTLFPVGSFVFEAGAYQSVLKGYAGNSL